MATQYRNERKHQISQADALVLRARLSHVMTRDSHAQQDGCYHIRSLYFDNSENKVLREKLDGVDERSKYRLRLYNHDPSRIVLERKHKLHGGCHKDQYDLSRAQAEALLQRDVAWMRTHDNAFVRSAGNAMLLDHLQPCVIVDYHREPFIYGPGNVRITLDDRLRTSLHTGGLLSGTALQTLPALHDFVVLEIKYDDFIPDFLVHLLGLDNRSRRSVSKYMQARVFG